MKLFPRGAFGALIALACASAVLAADVKPLILDGGHTRQVTTGETVAVTNGGTGATSASAARTALGIVIGTNVQAYDADLTTYAGITPSANVQTLLGSADYAAFRTSLGAGTGSGTVTTSGSPATGNLAKFSGAAAITNGDLSGDCTTSGTLAISCTKTGGISFAASATTDTTSASNISAGSLALGRIATIGANTVLGNGTGSTAVPTALSVPSCSTSVSALKWTSATGFGCTTLGTFADQNYATPPSIGASTPAAGKFTTLQATSTITTAVTGSTQCVYADSSGVLHGTGAACGGSSGNGSSWWLSNKPTVAAMTTVSGDATNLTLADDADVGVTFDAGVPVNPIVRLAEQTVATPTADWTLTARIDASTFSGISGGYCISARDATGGKLLTFCNNQSGYGVSAWTNMTTFSSDPLTTLLSGVTPSTHPWMRIVYNATSDNLTFFTSIDGKKWRQAGTALTRSTYFANRPNRVGFGAFYGRTTGDRYIGSVGYFLLN